MIGTIANTFLGATRDQFIIPLIILGYIWIDREIFYHATCLILVSILFNVALKVTFQIPLSPTLGKEGFAFPSGHMQSPATFFAWLALKSHSFIIRILILGILVGVGLSLVHFQYHNYYDVLAAVLFAALQIAVYCWLMIKAKHILPWILIFFSTLLLVYINSRVKHISGHVWMAYYALIGFTVSDKIFYRFKKTHTLREKVVNTILCFGTIFLVLYIFSIHLFRTLPVVISNLQWLIIGFIIPLLGQLAWGARRKASNSKL